MVAPAGDVLEDLVVGLVVALEALVVMVALEALVVVGA